MLGISLPTFAITPEELIDCVDKMNESQKIELIEVLLKPRKHYGVSYPSQTLEFFSQQILWALTNGSDKSKFHDSVKYILSK
ncbi:MAG: hypothetical protein NC200_00340 [Candidatus Gastranaerophilales bacterium]|nr:hypothetical protein [Candidatus Gastranaerophilales bacterium]